MPRPSGKLREVGAGVGLAVKVSNIDTVGRYDLTEKHWAEQEGGQQDSYNSH